MKLSRNEKLFGALSALTGFGLALKPLADPDNEWHLAAGRWMIENKSFIRFDPFSYTFNGKPWMSITWGHEIYTYLARALGGDALMVVATALLAALTLFSLFRAMATLVGDDTTSTRAALWSVIMAIGVSSQGRWGGRPEMWTHLCGSASIAVIVTYLSRIGTAGAWRTLKYLIPIQIVWVNTHGIFIMGPVFAAMALAATVADARWSDRARAKELVKPVALIALGVGAACLVNPRGLNGALFPFHLLKVLKSPIYAHAIPEATTPFDRGLWTNEAYELVVALALYLGCIVVGLWRDRHARAPRAVFAFGLVLWIGMAYVSVAAKRNIPLLVLWGAPFAAFGLWRFDLGRKKFIAATVALAVFAFGSQAPTLLATQSTLRTVGFRNVAMSGEGAAQFIESHHINGPSFATDAMANFFLRRLWGYRSYIDSRFAEVYDADHFQHYMNMLAAPAVLEAEVDARRIDNVIMGFNAPFTHATTQYLAGETKRWALVYLDGVAAIFVRRDAPAYQPWIARAEAERKTAVESFIANIAAEPLETVIGYGRALSIVGEGAAAKILFENATERAPRNSTAAAGLCNVQWMSCQGKDSETDRRCAAATYATCSEAIRLNADELPSLFTGALAALALGRPQSASALLERCLKIDPISFEAHWTLARVHAEVFKQAPNESSFATAVREYQVATQLRPNNAETLYEMAEFLDKAGNKADADLAYRQVLKLGAPTDVKKKIEDRFSKTKR